MRKDITPLMRKIRELKNEEDELVNLIVIKYTNNEEIPDSAIQRLKILFGEENLVNSEFISLMMKV